MNIKNLLVGSLVGGIVYFLLGWLAYGMLLASVFEIAEETRAAIEKPFNMGAMFVSCLGYGILLTYIYERWANISTFSTGATAGAVIGALSALWINMSMFSMYNFVTMQNSLIDIVVHAVVSGLTGGVIALVLGKMK